MKTENIKFCKILLVYIAVMSITLFSCQPDDDLDLPIDVEEADGANADIHVDEGGIGVVIDTREIVRKGYLPATAEISFQDFGQFNTALDIDEYTNFAVFNILNENLSDEEKKAFATGVVTTIVIKDKAQNSLTTYSDDRLVLNDSNFPLSLKTEMPYIKRPLNLKEGIPYLIMLENYPGEVLTEEEVQITSVGEGELRYKLDIYDILDDFNTFYQKFYFYHVEGDIYKIRYPDGLDKGRWMGAWNEGMRIGEEKWDASAAEEENAALFEFVQDEDGWSKLRLVVNEPGFDGDYYFHFALNRFLRFDNTTPPDRIRVVADNINWLVEDRGTIYNQPIIAPAELEFAYSATLKNCSPAILTEEVGKEESKSRTTTFGISESLQIFSSETESVSISVGLEVKAKIGATVPEVGEASEEVTVSEGITLQNEYTTSETTNSENTWEESTVTTSEVSRVRTLEIPPFTAVEVYDAIKSVDNVITPFVQTLRISGTYKDGNKAPLTGPEIATQLRFNFFGGIVSKVNDESVEITIRGKATMDQLFEASTEVNELTGACSD